MMRGGEMTRAAGAASHEDALAGSPRRIDTGARGASPPLRIGQSTLTRPGGVDRLAQLARLIEQDETLAAIVRDGRSEERVDLSRRGEKPASSPLARADEAFEHNGEGEAEWALVHRGSCEGPPGGPTDPPDYGEYDSPAYPNGLPDQRRGLRVFAALIALGLAGSASAFAYWTFSDRRGRGDEARVTAASINADKTAPSPRENSRPDEGPRDQPEERSVNAADRATTGAEEPADAKPPMPQVAPAMGIAFGAAPTRMAELTPGPAPVSPAGLAQDQPAEPKKPARQTAPATESNGAQGTHYVVQLCSERGEAAAHATSQVLQNKYRNAFAGRKPFVRRAELGDRGVYYRVQLGPFAIGEANEICDDLKKSGADCVVHRN
jgi:SPOR domain